MIWIVLDGPDASGKSTLLAALADELTHRGWTVETTREPGGFGVDPRLRRMALAAEDPVYRQLLMAADARSNFVANVQPYLRYPEGSEDVFVLQDRGAWSAAVYSDLEDPLVESLGHDGHQPDAYVLVEADPALCRARAEGRPGQPDQFDAAPLPVYEARASAYRSLADGHPGPVLRADGAGDLGVEADRLATLLEELAGEG